MRYINISSFSIITLFFLISNQLLASDANLSRRIDGIDIYMGISHVVNSPKISEVTKLGFVQGIRGKKHHVTVALFESGTGKRITDAKVVARIGEMGLSSNRKKLKQESYGQAISYGRDFYLAKEGPYWIDLSIKRNGLKQATNTRFEWQHH